jgi:hypothetical protein
MFDRGELVVCVKPVLGLKSGAFYTIREARGDVRKGRCVTVFARLFAHGQAVLLNGYKAYDNTLFMEEVWFASGRFQRYDPPKISATVCAKKPQKIGAL